MKLVCEGGGACRQVVDATYAVLVRAMFTQLERTAGPDVKHGDRLRLENYSLLENELKPLASRVTIFLCCVCIILAWSSQDVICDKLKHR